jgi:hypothetical protein
MTARVPPPIDVDREQLRTAIQAEYAEVRSIPPKASISIPGVASRDCSAMRKPGWSVYLKVLLSPSLARATPSAWVKCVLVNV